LIQLNPPVSSSRCRHPSVARTPTTPAIRAGATHGLPHAAQAVAAEVVTGFFSIGGIARYDALLGAIQANEARSKLPAQFPRLDFTRWDDLPANERDQFDHCATRHLYHALQLLGDGAESDRAVKHLVDSTNFWQNRQGKHLVILGYLYQITESIAAWADIRSPIQTLRLAVENHRA
jgi:hypothetical protein